MERLSYFKYFRTVKILLFDKFHIYYQKHKTIIDISQCQIIILWINCCRRQSIFLIYKINIANISSLKLNNYVFLMKSNLIIAIIYVGSFCQHNLTKKETSQLVLRSSDFRFHYLVISGENLNTIQNYYLLLGAILAVLTTVETIAAVNCSGDILKGNLCMSD